MKIHSLGTIAFVLLAALSSTAPSYVDSIGIAVGSVGSMTEVGSTTQDLGGDSATIDFFIALMG